MSSSAALACTAKDILHAHAVLHLWGSKKGRRGSAQGHKGCAHSLGQLVLDVFCFPAYCLLTLLMSPKDKKCKLIDG